MARFFLTGTLAHPCERMPFLLLQTLYQRPPGDWLPFFPKLELSSFGPCRLEDNRTRSLHVECRVCLAGHNIPEGEHGLVWIDHEEFPDPVAFRETARKSGVRVEILRPPPGIVFGQTVVYLAHARATLKSPGIIAAFKPTELVTADA